MSPSATPATQSAAAPRATNGAQARHQIRPSGISATRPRCVKDGVCVCVFFWLHALSAIQGLCRPALHGAVVPLWNLPGHPAVCTAAAQISGEINGLTGFAFGILHCFRLHGKISKCWLESQRWMHVVILAWVAWQEWQLRSLLSAHLFGAVCSSKA